MSGAAQLPDDESSESSEEEGEGFDLDQPSAASQWAVDADEPEVELGDLEDLTDAEDNLDDDDLGDEGDLGDGEI